MRTCFGLSQEDAGRVVDLLGTEAFRFEPADSPAPAAMLAVWRMAQWFGGRPIPAAALAFVGTDPPERGRGCASRLLRRTLAEARRDGAALATLYPANLPLYERQGFARAGITRRLSCPPDCFGPLRPDLPMRRMAPINADVLAAMRMPELRFSNGGVTRTEAMWTLALHPDGESEVDVYLAPGPDGPEGYLALTPPRNEKLIIADYCLPTPRAAAAAMGLLGSYRSRVKRIVWPGGPDDPLLYLTMDKGVEVEEWEEWMLRILDVPAALAARGWPPTLKGELLLEIDDPLIAENQGVWKLSVNEGKGFVAPAHDACCGNIRLSSTALAGLFGGYINAASLRRMGRIEATEMQVYELTSFFSGPYPYLPDRF